MNASSPQDRVKVDKIISQLCEAKDMFYEITNHHTCINAKLFNKHKKFIGLAGIESDNRKFGSQPVVNVKKEAVDFLVELWILTGLPVALVVKFRDKVAYYKLDFTEFSSENGKYHIPINLFCVL